MGKVLTPPLRRVGKEGAERAPTYPPQRKGRNSTRSSTIYRYGTSLAPEEQGKKRSKGYICTESVRKGQRSARKVPEKADFHLKWVKFGRNRPKQLKKAKIHLELGKNGLKQPIGSKRRPKIPWTHLKMTKNDPNTRYTAKKRPKFSQKSPNFAC